MISTNDKIIRTVLREFLDKELERYRASGHNAEIFEELGIRHGMARIDFAIINGIMHGYEIKSDRDTLNRLPEQMEEFSAVFDKLTLVVGKHHLYNAMHIIPDWWGVMVAKSDSDSNIIFQTIREPDDNKGQVKISMARLLWREEALQILEERHKADGMRHKPRELIYKKLADILNTDDLREKVSTLLVSREGWRSGVQPMPSGD